MYQLYPSIKFNNEQIQDISTRFTILSSSVGQLGSIFRDYVITEWKSPDDISFEIYGTCDYTWILLLVNNIIDPFYDWILSNDELQKYIYNKYGSNINKAHHYEYNNLIYNYPITDSKKVTNAEYEYNRNEKKRKIRIVIPESIPAVIKMIAQI